MISKSYGELIDTVKYIQNIIFKIKKNEKGEIIYILSEGRIAEEFGITTKEIYGKTPFEVFSSSQAEYLLSLYEQGFQGIEVRQELHYRGKILDTTLTPIFVDGTVQEVVGSCIDITEVKRYEDVLQKTDALSALGQLAAGIAHELRNPLTSLKGFTQLFRYRHPEDQKYYDIMFSELERIEFILNEFLLLAKPTKVQFQEESILSLLESIISVLDSQARLNNIELITSFEDDLPPILCEKNQIKQVFMNILKNGIESMANGGEITIKAFLIDAAYICVQCIDQGCGIPKHILQKLGEPFFTTKNKGTGLGLMMCQSILKNHHGYMEVESELGKGSTFSIFIPITSYHK